MPVAHEPSLKLSQLRAHLPPLLGSAPSLCPLLFSKATVLGSSLCEARKAVLGSWSSACTSVELATPYRQLGRTLARRAPARSGLSPLALQVWAVEPWFWVSFHSAQLSSVYGVLLYPILSGMARRAWLGPRTADRAKISNVNCAQATILSRSTVRGPIPTALGSWSPVHGPRWDGSVTRGKVLCSEMQGFCHWKTL